MNEKNYLSLAFIRKAIPLFLMLLFVNVGWGQTTVTYDFSDSGAVTGLEASPAIALDGNIGFASFKNLGTSNPALNGGQLRLYQNTTKGGSIKIYAQNEMIITSVVVYASGTTGPAQYSVDGVGNNALSINSGTYTISSINATNEVEFWCVGSSSSSRIYVDKFEVTYVPSNQAPTASNVVITGLPNTTVELQGSYDYADADADAEGTSTFKWYTATDASGTDALAIDGATASSFTLTNAELNKYIRFGVIPVAAAGTPQGMEVYSDWIGPVNAAGTPVLNAGLIADFPATCLNITTTANSFTLLGNNLESDVTIQALAGYTYAETEEGTYTATLTLSPLTGEINTTIYVKFTPTVVQSYNGNVTISGGGATDVAVSVIAEGINTPASATTGASSVLTAISATLSASLTEGCSAVTSYGIEYSTTEDFVNGTGTDMAASNLDAGTFSVDLSALNSNTTYYYKAYATDATGTVYGTQSSFTTITLGAPLATAATAITSIGFTANWEAVTGATSYELDVYTSEVTVGEIFNQTFTWTDNGTGGNDGAWSGSIASATSGLNTDLNNWTYNAAYKGDNCIKLGSSSNQGYLTTPALNFTGNGTLTFRAGAWNGASEQTTLKLEISNGGELDFAQVTMVKGAFSEYEIQITNATALTQITFRGFANSNSRFFLDDVKIVGNMQSNDYIIENQNVGNVTSYVVNGLESGKEYFHVVRAVDAGSTSADSNEITTTTLVGSTTFEDGAWTNGNPTADLEVIIEDDFTTIGDLEAKSVTVNSGIFTVATGTTLTVTNGIVNNAAAANFIIQTDAVVLQATTTANTGNVTVQRNSADLYRQDYTLWSSPVTGQNLRAFSPQTVFSRFYSYDTTADTNGAYLQEIFTTEDMNTKLFTVAKGYLIRMPNDWTEFVDAGTPGTPYLGGFIGNLNNGDQQIALSLANTKMNLVGNPYPSPISISSFFAANPNIEQSLYFWRKRNGVAGSGYATYSGLGITSAQVDVNGTDLDDTIKPGQGFFVNANTANTVSFTNAMRTNTGGTMFFKSANDTNEVNRFWLNLSDANNVVGQTLIGYATGATQGVDTGIDAVYFNDSALALTSLIGNSEYAIQGRSVPFVDTDIVPLGFKSDVAGIYTISLANFDGLFTGEQVILLKDNVTGAIQNLKVDNYTFTTEAGIFNERFEVQFNATLNTTNPELAHNTILIGTQNQQILINAGTVVMEKIELIDVSGRIIYTQEGVEATSATIENMVANHQMLIVRISTKNNGVVNQKIIF